jgi:serine O-acetyltransferase
MGRLIDDLRADYRVNSRVISRITVTAFRFNQAAHRGRWQIPKRIAAKVIDTLWLQLVVGADMDGRAQVGPGLRLPHGGRLVGIDPGAVIGSNVTLFPNSGAARGGPSRGVATIGDSVTIGRNGGVVGPVTIGDGATIAINSIAYSNVAPGETVIGNPAVPIREAVKQRTQATGTRRPAVPDRSSEQTSVTPIHA